MGIVVNSMAGLGPNLERVPPEETPAVLAHLFLPSEKCSLYSSDCSLQPVQLLAMNSKVNCRLSANIPHNKASKL